MKTHFKLLFALFAMVSSLSAQVKIGDNPQNIDASSILELESSNRVLVITRVTTQQMDAIIPLQGAVVYNTDVQCIHYYNGAIWVNICEALDNAFTVSTLAIVNEMANDSTIVITQQDDNLNFEVNEITGANVVDGSINGQLDLQFNSITADQLAENSVGQSELQDNTVGELEIDFAEVTLNSFNNDAGFITGANIVSGEPNNALTDNNGAFFDDTQIQADIVENAVEIGTNATTIQIVTNNLTDHIADDLDIDPANEIQDATEVDINLITGITGDNVQLALESLQAAIENLNSGGANTDEQDLVTNGDPGNISIENGSTIILNVDDADADPTNELQNAAQVEVDDSGVLSSTDVQAALEALQTDVNGLAASGGADGVVTNVELTGTDLEFTGTAPGFNGIVSLAGLGGGVADGNTTNVSLTTRDDSGDGTNDTLTLTDSDGAIVEIALAQLGASGGGVADGNTTNVSLTTRDDSGDGTNDTLTLTDSDNAVVEIALAQLGASGGGVADGNTTNVSLTTRDDSGDGTNDTLTLTDSNGAVVEIALAQLGASGGGVADGNTTNVTLETTDADADGINDTLTLTDSDNAVVEVPLADIAAVTVDGNTTNVTLATTDIDADGINDNLTLTDSDGAVVEVPLADIAAVTADGNTTNVTLETIDADADGINDTLTLTDSDGAVVEVPLADIAAVVADGNTTNVTLATTDIDADGINDNLTLTDSDGAVVEVPLADIAAVVADGNTTNLTLETTDVDADGTDDNLTLTDSDGNAIDLPLADIAAVVADGNTTNATLIASDTDGNGIDDILTLTDTDGFEIDVSLANIGDVDTDDQTVDQFEIDAANLLNISLIDDGAAPSTVDLTSFLDNTDDQTASEVNFITDPDFDANGTPETNVIEALNAIDSRITASVGNNLENSNLTQTAGENRTYNLNGNDLIFTGTGSIGIGNAANPPQNKLHVAGEIRSEGFNSSQGTVGLPAYSFSTGDDIDTGMYRPAADEIGFSVGGIEALRIDEAAGNTNVIVNENIELKGTLTDSNVSVGKIGQTLSSTGTGTTWSGPYVAATGKIQGTTIMKGNGIANVVTAPAPSQNGDFQVNLVPGVTTDADYTVQLTVTGPFLIFISAQGTNSFSLSIRQLDGSPLVTGDNPAYFITITDL